MVYDPKAAKEQAFYQGLLGLAAPLLAAGTRGPSTTPGGGGFGSALGQGLLGFQQGQQGYMNNSMRQGLLGMQMDQAEREQARVRKYDDLFKAPTGAQVLSAGGGGPTMANAQTMANPQPSGLLAGLSPQEIEMARAAGPDKGFDLIAEARKRAATPPPVQEFYDPQTGQPYKAQYSGGKWERVGGAKTSLPAGMRIGMNGQPEFIPEYLAGQKQVREAGRPQTNVNLPPMNKAEDEAFGKQLVSNFASIQDRGNAAQDAINQLRVARAIARDSQLPGELQMAVGNTAVALGIPLPEGIKNRVTDGQAFVATMNNLVLTKMQAQKGPQTENDAKRIEMTMARLGNTPEARDFLLRAATSLASRDVEQSRFFEDWRRQKGTLDGASTAWRERVGQLPLVGTNPNSNLPVFFDEFSEGMKKANPGATEQQILQVWKQKYGG